MTPGNGAPLPLAPGRFRWTPGWKRLASSSTIDACSLSRETLSGSRSRSRESGLPDAHDAIELFRKALADLLAQAAQ
ncbi:hypothetical protein [Cupriavidus sp. CP313]